MALDLLRGGVGRRSARTDATVRGSDRVVEDGLIELHTSQARAAALRRNGFWVGLRHCDLARVYRSRVHVAV